MTKDTNPKVTELHKLLSGDLKDVDVRWECETMISIIVTLNKTGLGKIAFFEELLGKLQSQVLGAPIVETDQDEDTSEARPFKTRDMDANFEEAKEVFARWQCSGRKLKEISSSSHQLRRSRTKIPRKQEKREVAEGRGTRTKGQQLMPSHSNLACLRL